MSLSITGNSVVSMKTFMDSKKYPDYKTRTARGQSNTTGALGRPKIQRKLEPMGPPKAGAFKQKKVQPSTFRIFYDRSDLPITIDNTVWGPRLRWITKCELSDLDYHHYLPLFFDGLREIKDPYGTLSAQGVQDLLENGGPKIIGVVPQLIIPMKLALESRNPFIMCRSMKALQQLATSAPHVGEALVIYYRQLLPMLNMFKNKNINSGDGIEYGQCKKVNLGDMIEETLNILETYGGEDAFINIKYMVPTYQSCIQS